MRRSAGLSRQGSTPSASPARPPHAARRDLDADRDKTIDDRQDARPRDGDRARMSPPTSGRRTWRAGRRSARAWPAHAAALAEAGLKLAWHNHDFEYVTLPDGSRPIDHLLAAPGVSVRAGHRLDRPRRLRIRDEIDKFPRQGRRLPHQGRGAGRASPGTTAGPTSAAARSTGRSCGRRSPDRARTSSSSSTTTRPTGGRSRRTPTSIVAGLTGRKKG